MDLLQQAYQQATTGGVSPEDDEKAALLLAQEAQLAQQGQPFAQPPMPPQTEPPLGQAQPAPTEVRAPLPSPHERVAANARKQGIPNRARESLPQFSPEDLALQEEVQRYSDVAQARRDNPMFNLAGDSDVARGIMSTIPRGFGTAASGLGMAANEFSGPGGNAVGNLLSGVGQGLQDFGEKGLSTQSMRSQYALEDSQMTGNIFTGENISFGENPSFRGLGLQVLHAIGDMAPVIAGSMVGGPLGYALATGAGAAQGGYSQGKEHYENIMSKTIPEMAEFSDAFKLIMEKNPDIDPRQAQQMVAEDARRVALVTGGAIAGAGGALTKFLWGGAAIGKGSRSAAQRGATGSGRLAAEAKKPLNTLPKRAAAGFVEEAAQEVAESDLATMAVNKTVGADMKIGEQSFANAMLGGLTGATVNTAGGVADSVKAGGKKLKDLALGTGNASNTNSATAGSDPLATAESVEVTREAVKKIQDDIDNGKLDERIKNVKPSEYKVMAAALSERVTNADTPQTRKAALDDVAKLSTKLSENLSTLNSVIGKGAQATFQPEIDAVKKTLAIAKQAIADGNMVDVAKKVAAKQEQDLKMLERKVAHYDSVSPEAIKENISTLRSTIDSLGKEQRAGQSKLNAETATETAAKVETATDTNAKPEKRTQAANQVIDSVMNNMEFDVVDDIDAIAQSNVPLSEDRKKTVGLIQKINSILKSDTGIAEAVHNPVASETALGFASLASRHQSIQNAIATGNKSQATTNINNAKDYSIYKRGKVAAAIEAKNKAAAETDKKKQYAIVYQKNANGVMAWEVIPHKRSKKNDRKLRRAGGLSFGKNSGTGLIKGMTAEADFIDAHIELMEHHWNTKQNEKQDVADKRATKKAEKAAKKAKAQATKNATAPATAPATASATAPAAGTTGTASQASPAPATPSIGNTPNDTSNMSDMDGSDFNNDEFDYNPNANDVAAAAAEAAQAGVFDPTSTNKLAGKPESASAPESEPESESTAKKDREPDAVVPEKYQPILNQYAKKTDKELKELLPTLQANHIQAPPASNKSTNLFRQLQVVEGLISGRFVRSQATNAGKTKQSPATTKPESTKPTNKYGTVQDWENMLPMDLFQLHRRALMEVGQLQNAAVHDGVDNTAEFEKQLAQLKELSAYVFRNEPEMAALYDLMAQPKGASPSDVIQWAMKHASEHQQELLRLIANTNSVDNLKAFTFGLMQTPEYLAKTTLAAWQRNLDTIVIIPASFTELSTTTSLKYTVGAVIHELMHPIGQSAMESNPELQQEALRLRNVINDWFTAPENQTAIIALQNTNPDAIKAMRYCLQVDSKTDIPFELLTKILDNDNLKKILATIPDPESSNNLSVLESFFNKLIEAIQSYLGDANVDGSVLMGVLNLTNEIILNDPATSAPFDTGTTATPETPAATPDAASTTAAASVGITDAEVQAFVDAIAAEEDAVIAGDKPLYGYESEGEIEAHEGPMSREDALASNFIRAYLKSKHRTPMSYSNRFIENLFINGKIPLVHFSRYLSQPEKLIAKFRESGRPGEYRALMKMYHTKWVEDLQTQIQPETDPYHKLSNPISYFFHENESGELELDPNVASAMAVAAFRYAGEEASHLWLNATTKQKRSALRLDNESYLYKRLEKRATTIGQAEQNVRLQLGRAVMAQLDMTMPKTTPVNVKSMVEAALGKHALNLLIRDGILTPRTYNGFQVRPEAIALEVKLKKLKQFPNKATMKHRGRLSEHLATTNLTTEEQAEFMRHAFASHQFITTARSEEAAADVAPLFTRLAQAGVYQGNEDISQKEFNALLDKTDVLRTVEKDRVRDVFKAWKNPKYRKTMPTARLSQITQITKGSRSFMDDLLGVESGRTLPHINEKKAGFKGDTRNRSDRKISKYLRRQLDKMNKIPRKINQGMLSTDPDNPGVLFRLREVNDQFLPDIAGYEHDTAYTSEGRRAAIDGRNQGYLREADAVFEHVEDVMEGDSEVPFFKNFVAWTNDRIGESSQGWNAQASKLHRELESAPEWEFTIDPAEQNDAHKAFKWAVAQKLGAGVNKVSPETGLKMFDNLRQDPEIQKAVALAAKMENDPMYVWTPEEMQQFTDIVKAQTFRGEGMAFMRGVFEMAKYEKALTDKTPFQSDITATIDGRTSGPAISLMQYGMTEKAHSQKFMVLTGFIPVGSAYQNGGQAIEEERSDMYKEVVKGSVSYGNKAIADIEKSVNNAKLLAEADPSGANKKDHAIKRLYQKQLNDAMQLRSMVIGDLVTDQGTYEIVESMARDIVKEPTTANVFGASDTTLENTLSEYFLEQFYLKLEKHAKNGDKDKANALIAQLNKVLPEDQQIDIRADGIYTKALSNTQIESVYWAVKKSLSEHVAMSIADNFAESREVANHIKKVMSLAQSLYKATFDAEKRRARNKRNAEFAKTEDREKQMFTPRILQDGKQRVSYQPDLTQNEIDAIHEKLSPLVPNFHSPSSLAEGNLDFGLSAFKSGVQNANEVNILSGEDVNSDTVDLDSGVRTIAKLKEPIVVQETGAQFKHSWVAGQMYDPLVVGISALANLAHSQDASVAHELMTLLNVIGAHDGFISGATVMSVLGPKANKALLDTFSNYSAAEIISRTAVRSIDNFNRIRGLYAEDSQFLKDMEAALPKRFNPDTQKMEIEPESPIEHAYKLLLAAEGASRQRLLALSRTAKVDQYYYSDNSAYELTDEERAAFQKRADNLAFVAGISRLRDKKGNIEAFPSASSEPGAAQAAWLDLNTAAKDFVTIQAFLDAEKQEAQDAATDPVDDTLPDRAKAAVEKLQLQPWNGTPVTMSLLTKLNAAMNKINKAQGKSDTRKLLFEAVDSVVSETYIDNQSLELYDEPTLMRENLVSVLIDPSWSLDTLVPNGKLRMLREWHDTYHSAADTDTRNEYFNDGPDINPTMEYTTADIFDALDNQRLPQAEATHLQSVLKDIADLSAQIDTGIPAQELGETANELAARHVADGIGPFSSHLQQIGVQMSPAQAFAAEQVEITMQAALQSQTLADNLVVKIHQHAKSQFNSDGREFYPGENWSTATDIEKAQAKAVYDLVFTGKNNRSTSKSDHLSRFVSLALTYPPLRNQLNALEAESVPSIRGEKIGAQLEHLFDQALHQTSQRFNNVTGNQPRADALKNLARKLALNEQRRRLALQNQKGNLLNPLDRMGSKLGDKAAKAVSDFSQSPIVKNSRFEMVKSLGALSRATAEDRVDEVIRVLERWRDHELPNTRLGFMGSIINQVRGETDQTQHLFALRQISKLIEQRRKEKKDIMQQEVLEQFEDPDSITDVQSHAATQLYLRTDANSLLSKGYSVEGIHEMVVKDDKRRAKIKKLQDRLLTRDNGKALLIDTKDMAYEIATGRTVSEFGYQNAQLLVADNMPKLSRRDKDTGLSLTEAGKQLANEIDELTTLLAIDMSPQHLREEIKPLVDREAKRGDKDGFSYMLNLHNRILNTSADTLFSGDGFSRIKGYLRESYNPYNSYEVADSTRGEQLLKEGYTLHGPVDQSGLALSYKPITARMKQKHGATGNVSRQATHQPNLYVLKGVGLADYQTGTLLNQQESARGKMDYSRAEFLPEGPGKPYMSSARSAKMMADERKRAKSRRIKDVDPKTYRPSLDLPSHEMPVFNQRGYVTGYRYKASHSTRDQVMERDNRFHVALGVTAGSVYSKEHSKKHNAEVVQQLAEFYKEDSKDNPNAYISVSPKSSDARMREAYYLLPNDTKKAIRDNFGGNELMIRKDMLDLMLGYRNLTTDEVVNRAHKKINQMFNRTIGKELLTGKAKVRVRRLHDHTADIVRRYRDFVVIKNAYTLIDNVKSNAILLMNYNVPMRDLVNDHRRAFQGLKDYKRDHRKLLRLQMRLDAQPEGTDTTDMELAINELEFALARNPVKALVDQGMFQTIVDDVDLDKENESYLNPTEQLIEGNVARLPKIVQDAGRTAFVAQGTPIYNMLAQGTQMSDFIARFVLHEHFKREQAKGSDMTDEKLMSTVREAFVNYNTVDNQFLNYLNDVGLVRFTKYFLGTQKIIYDRMRNAPARSMAAYMADRHVDGLSSIQGSNIMSNLGSPLENTVLDAPSVVDEPIVINSILGFL